MQYNLITILGPTAVGKTRLAALLADRFDGEIISADSRQVYRGMDIGTGKDIDDYKVNGKVVPYHLIDVIDPKEEFNVFNFYKMFFEELHVIESRSKIPFLAGGTGLYIHAIHKDYELKEVQFDEGRFQELNELTYDELAKMLIAVQPKQHNTTDLVNKERVIRALMIAEKDSLDNLKYKKQMNPLVIGIYMERELVRKRITARLSQRLEGGMIDEVKQLVDGGVSYERLKQLGLEYKFIAMYLLDEISYDQMFEKLNIAIHQFSKRQMTWFRKMEKEGIKINWITGADFERAEEIILKNYF